MTLAHEIAAVGELPFPVGMMVAVIALILVGVFALLALRRREPVFQGGVLRSGQAMRLPVVWALRGLGLVVLLSVIAQLLRPGLASATTGTRTIAPVAVWVLAVVVVPTGSVVIGNWYAALNPWRTLAVLFGLGEDERPSRLGVWPATIALIALAWLQVVWPGSSDPVSLGAVAAVYTLLLLGGVAAIGLESGLTTFDVFTPYNRLVSAIAPWGLDDLGRVYWRGWLRALAVVPRWRGLWAFVAAMVGTVLFDGMSGLAWFPAPGSMLGRTTALIATVLLVAVAFRLAAPGGDAQGYAHALVPLAFALVFAHYFDLMLVEGQQIVAVASDPLGLGWDLFGTAGTTTRYLGLGPATVWYIGATSIVAGAVTAIALVHDRALVEFGGDAVRAQFAMLALMIALTTLSLLALAG